MFQPKNYRDDYVQKKKVSNVIKSIRVSPHWVSRVGAGNRLEVGKGEYLNWTMILKPGEYGAIAVKLLRKTCFHET